MYEITIEKPGRYVVASDGVYQTADGDNAPVICNINNDGHITEIICQTVESVTSSGELDLSELDARYAGLNHTHDFAYANLNHVHNYIGFVSYVGNGAASIVVPHSLGFVPRVVWSNSNSGTVKGFACSGHGLLAADLSSFTLSQAYNNNGTSFWCILRFSFFIS